MALTIHIPFKSLGIGKDRAKKWQRMISKKEKLSSHKQKLNLIKRQETGEIESPE